ncbi:MAG: serine/threonine-protein kinase, partial [Pseudomonadota bacterium]
GDPEPTAVQISINDVLAHLQEFRNTEPVQKPVGEVSSEYLPAGTTLLVGQYIIDGYLNCGGFGITYTARDSLGRKVVIKECFPGEMVFRDGKSMAARSPKYENELKSIVRGFVKEAHSLANVKHDHIVHVHQIFEENGTAYMAMDFVDGPDLLDVIEGEGTLTPREVEALTRKLLKAVLYLHRLGMLHRDVSPDNVLIERGAEPVLIDFGAARHFDPEDTNASPKMKFVKDGYSPHEYYVEGAPQGPFSDVYALAATIYHTITGSAPVDAPARAAALEAGQPDPFEALVGNVQGYPSRFLRAVDSALTLNSDERLQTAEAWLERIGAEAPSGIFKPVTAVLDSFSVFEERARQASSDVSLGRRAPLVAGVAALALVLGGAVVATQTNWMAGDDADGVILIEPTPVALAQIAQQPAPEQMATVWPDGFEALRGAIADDASPLLDAEAPGVLPAVGLERGPQVILPDVAQAPSVFVPSVPLRPALNMTLPEPEVLATLPNMMDRSFWSVPVPQPPRKSPLTSVEAQATNQLRAIPSQIDVQSIAPVSYGDRLAALPEAPDRPSLSLDTTAPEYVPLSQSSTTLKSQSRWVLELPFDARPQRVGDGGALVITALHNDANLSLIGPWLEEGLVLVGLNGSPLEKNVPLIEQLGENFEISPDGMVKATLWYRKPREELLDQGELSVPIIRKTVLADGTILETRKVGASWVTSVAVLGGGTGTLELGDLIIGNQ